MTCFILDRTLTGPAIYRVVGGIMEASVFRPVDWQLRHLERLVNDLPRHGADQVVILRSGVGEEGVATWVDDVLYNWIASLYDFNAVPSGE